MILPFTLMIKPISKFNIAHSSNLLILRHALTAINALNAWAMLIWLMKIKESAARKEKYF